MLLSKSEVAYKFPELLPLVSSTDFKSKCLFIMLRVFEIILEQNLLVRILQRNRINKERKRRVCVCVLTCLCMERGRALE